MPDPRSPLSPLPEVIAHRGANREAPESSLAAFEAAIELGAGGIELDVQMTADGIPVVHHDPRLPLAGRTGQGPAIAILTLDDLRRLSPVATLDEVVDSVGGRCRLYVEIKAAPALLAVLRSIRHLGDGCAVHAFDHRVISRAAEVAPEVPRGILLVSRLVDPLAAMEAVRARDLWQQVDLIDADLVERVHAAGRRVIAWTANDAARARELIALGVDGLCTDALREIRSLVDGHG